VGASTITQQVAKNILLSSEQSMIRKMKEAIIAVRMEQLLTKDRIMELYLNEIYLGAGSYGVAMAALNYFNKSLDELTLAEAAYLAALPKAPSRYSAERNYEGAMARRNWVLGRMLDDGVITQEEADEARALPIVLNRRGRTELVRNAEYFSEEVRRQIIARHGSGSIYLGGLTVRTTVDPRLQNAAVTALRSGLEAYDRRMGYRGPIARIQITAPVAESDGQSEPRHEVSKEVWQEQLTALRLRPPVDPWVLAVVIGFSPDNQDAIIGLRDGTTSVIRFNSLRWARESLPRLQVGPEIKDATQVFTPGDVLWTEHHQRSNTYLMRQEPLVQGAIVVMDPHTGRVLAMHGGYSFRTSHFNRVTQSRRQPGSAFKSFVYLTALENGFTPSSIILDAPFVYDQGPGLPRWKPENYSTTFYGPTTLRVGLERSRNLMTVRLANALGMKKVAENAERLGIYDRMQPLLSMSLGAGETSLMRLTAAYATLVNGGKEISPVLVDRIQDRTGKTIFKPDQRECPDCGQWSEYPPHIDEHRQQVVDPIPAYQIVNILVGAVESGTGSLARIRGVPLAGKTGTTNNNNDAWFIGMSPDLVVGVHVGYDTPTGLGRAQTGGVVAAPIFRQFMQTAMTNKQPIPFRRPAGVRLVRVNHRTGRPATAQDTDVVLEAFVSQPAAAQPPPLIGDTEDLEEENGARLNFGRQEQQRRPEEDISDEEDTIRAGGIY